MAEPNLELGPVRKQANVSLRCPKLTDSNYTTRSILMKQILTAYSLWEITEVGTEGDEKKVATTKAVIFKTLPEDILMQVAQYETAKEVWDSIKILHVEADMVQKARLHTLRAELEAMKMKENKKMDVFAKKLNRIRVKFRSLGSVLKDKVIVRKLFSSAPRKFLPFIASVELYSDIDNMLFEDGVGRMKAFEERLKVFDEHEDMDQNKLLLVGTSNGEGNQDRGSGSGRGEGKQGRGGGFGRGHGTRDMSTFRCFECGEFEHFGYECTKWDEKKEEANLAEDVNNLQLF
ncbi:uncharacterized protein LOC110869697 [Helianthus annuus]|uniref:uncharacterized protein LOC110869697 n=1 Tax=Helianthus annuus TaxID=4232 RepID=UPI000B904C21|nr:uncharacterized protein LOC110869697 [Helianthus annuus]